MTKLCHPNAGRQLLTLVSELSLDRPARTGANSCLLSHSRLHISGDPAAINKIWTPSKHKDNYRNTLKMNVCQKKLHRVRGIGTPTKP